MAPLQVEIWSDLVCPWCYIGKRRFEAAVERFDGEVEVSWRSFELDPSAPAVREHTATEHLAAKYGMSREQARVQPRADDRARRAGGARVPLRAALAAATASTRIGSPTSPATHGNQDEAMERMMRGYFTEGVAIGDREALIELAAEIGLDARAALEGDEYADAVREDEELAQPDRDPGRAVLRARPPLRRVRRPAGRAPRAGAGEGMRLSVLDQSPVPEGSTGPDALRNTLDLAQLADRLGYHRYWLAEHHGLSASPGRARRC